MPWLVTRHSTLRVPYKTLRKIIVTSGVVYVLEPNVLNEALAHTYKLTLLARTPPLDQAHQTALHLGHTFWHLPR